MKWLALVPSSPALLLQAAAPLSLQRVDYESEQKLRQRARSSAPLLDWSHRDLERP